MNGAAKLRLPIVMTPGLFGIDEVRAGGRVFFQYYRQIPEVLTAAGNRVVVARLRPLAGVAERACQLKAFLERHFPDEAVHLISHSLGELDGRYLISRLGMAHRVRTLTTVGTPHRGTAFADWGLRRLERVVRPLLEWACIPHQAFYDLTTAACHRFNHEVLDVPEVRYFSVAGHYECGSWRADAWSLPHGIVAEAEGPNDGVVSVASATWGEHLEVWDCDHFGLVNWPNPVLRAGGRWEDRSPRYAALTQLLAAAEPG